MPLCYHTTQALSFQAARSRSRLPILGLQSASHVEDHTTCSQRRLFHAHVALLPSCPGESTGSWPFRSARNVCSHTILNCVYCHACCASADTPLLCRLCIGLSFSSPMTLPPGPKTAPFRRKPFHHFPQGTGIMPSSQIPTIATQEKEKHRAHSPSGSRACSCSATGQTRTFRIPLGAPFRWHALPASGEYPNPPRRPHNQILTPQCAYTHFFSSSSAAR